MKEFYKLAGIMLACRWEIMGNIVIENSHRSRDPFAKLHFAFLGLHDYEQEMKLLVSEMLNCDRLQSPPIVGGMGPIMEGVGDGMAIAERIEGAQH